MRARKRRRPSLPPQPPPLELKDQQALRSCLRCGEQFDSHGPGNRVCRDCQKANEKVSVKTMYRVAPDEHVSDAGE